MGFLDRSVPISKYKYNVKHCDEPLPFGKLKGFTLREISKDAESQSSYFLWCLNKEYFGPEIFWGTEIIEIYQKIIDNKQVVNKKIYFEDKYWDHYETDYQGIH